MNKSRVALFKGFLEYKGLWDDYVRLYSHKRYYTKVDDWLGMVKPEYYVSGAFVWTVSLWEVVNKEWLKLLGEYENKNA